MYTVWAGNICKGHSKQHNSFHKLMFILHAADWSMFAEEN